MDTCVSEQDKADTVRQIRLFMLLTPWWLEQSDEVKGKRWSRTTLAFTQFWPIRDRVEVWWRVMHDDPTSSVHKTDDYSVTDGRVAELLDRIEVFGDDGGLNDCCGILPH